MISVHTDSDWAGCVSTRKSTQGGVVMIGRACVKTWSSTQAIIALSSGEAEFYDIAKCASVGLGCVAMCRDLGFAMKL